MYLCWVVNCIHKMGVLGSIPLDWEPFIWRGLSGVKCAKLHHPLLLVVHSKLGYICVTTMGEKGK